MSKFISDLLFSIIVTAAMNATDMAYHLLTGWVVHLNYVAVKLTIIFLSVWMITHFIGIGKEEGIAASVLGPFMFYIYYLFANATLNREFFRIDEQFWFFFLHFAFMLAAYFGALMFLNSKKRINRAICFGFLAIFSSIAFDALFVMAKWRIQGIDEETAAKMMNFAVISIPIIVYAASVIISLAIDAVYRKKYLDGIIAGLISGIGIFFLLNDLGNAIFSFIFVLIVYYLIHFFKKGLSGAAHE